MKIAIDLDDVIADTTPNLHRFHNEMFGTNFSIDNQQIYNLAKVWNIEQEECTRRFLLWYSSDYFPKLKPVSGVAKALAELSKHHDLVIVTSRLEVVEEKTKEWLEKYLPDVKLDIHFANHYFGTNSHKKSDHCQRLGIDLLIEDCLDYATECAEKNIEVLLYDWPWNQTKKLPKNVTRVKSWDEIVKVIESKSF